MAEQVETIVLEIPYDRKGAEQANRDLDAIEKKASRAVESAGQAAEAETRRVISVIDRSKNSIERMVASIEKRAAFAGATSPVERLVRERELMLKRIGGDSQAVDRVRGAFDKLIAAEEKGTTGLSSFGKGLTRFIQQPVASAGSAMEGLLGGLGKIGGIAAAGIAGLAAFATAGYNAAKSLGEMADRTGDIAVRTGLTIKEVGDFSFAMKRAGGDISGVESVMRKLSQGLADASEEGKNAREGLRDLGIISRNADGSLRPMSGILEDISIRLNAIPDAANRNAAAIKILGRGALDSLPDLLELSAGLERARQLGFAPDAEDIKRWDSYHKQIAEADALWERLKQKLKEPLAVPITVFLKWAVGNESPNNPVSIASRARGATPPNAESLIADQIRRELQTGPRGQSVNRGLGTIQRRLDLELEGSIAARSLGGFLATNDPLVAAQDKLERLKKKYEESRTEAERLAETGNVLPSVADKHRAAVEAAGAAYRRQSDLVKELQKDESRRLSNLEKMRDLLREGSTFLRIGTGALETIVSGQDIFNANQPLRRAPRLRRPGEFNPNQGPAAFPLSEGLAFFGTEQVFVSPNSSRRGGAGDLERGAAAGAAEREKILRFQDIQLAKLSAEAELTTRILDLRRGSDGEINVALRIAAVRDKALKDEYAVTGDVVRLRAGQLQNELELRSRIAEELQRQFDTIKREASDLFETLFTRAKDFPRQLAESIRAAFLRPVTEGLGNLTANILRPIIYGEDGNGGIAGRLRGLFGQVQNPMKISTDLNTLATQQNTTALVAAASAFSGGAAIANIPGGGGGGLSGILGIPGIGGFGSASAPGGTPTFTGAPIAGIGGSRTLAPGGGFTGGFGGRFGPALNGALLLGGTTLATNGLQRGGKFGTLESTLGGAGIGFALGGPWGGWLGAGIGLAAGGLRQGGIGGLAATTAGGALIGLQFGGPIGAAIGAGIGFVAGLVRLFIKGAEEKLIEKVKSAYGLTIDRSYAKTLVAIAKQNFGGNLDVAIRAPQVIDMLQLYAMATGQRFGQQARLLPASLVQSGNQLYQNPTYQNGVPVSFGGGLPTLGGSNTFIPTNPNGYRTAAPAQPVVVQATLQLDPAQTLEVFEGRAVKVVMENPKAVQSATTQANRSNFKRRENLALLASPGALTS